jgi:hypothetical protein
VPAGWAEVHHAATNTVIGSTASTARRADYATAPACLRRPVQCRRHFLLLLLLRRLDGHYKGVTSQNETFEFDIYNGGLSFRGLKTGQINEGCTPQFHLYWGYLNWPTYVVPVSSSGDFTIDTDLTGWHVGDWPSTGDLTIRGHMNGRAGTGSIEKKTAFNGNGTRVYVRIRVADLDRHEGRLSHSARPWALGGTSIVPQMAPSASCGGLPTHAPSRSASTPCSSS